MLRSISTVLLCVLLNAWSPAWAAGPRRGVRFDRTPENAAAWLQVYAIPMSAALTSSDLRPIAAATRNAKILGLGDGSHGTREFFLVKTRLIAELLQEGQIDTIAFEAPLPMGRTMDAFARGDAPTPLPHDRDVTYWFWQSEEIASFLDEVRRHNRANLDDVRIVGVDAWDAPSISAELLRDLDSITPQLHAEARSALACFADPSSYWKQRGAYRATCRAAMEQIGVRLEAFAAPFPAAVAKARETLSHLLQAESIWASLPAERMTRRDLAMAENLLRLASTSDGQTVYWAHNGHAGKTGYPDNPSIPSAGAHLRDALGDAYFAIGTTTLSGTFRGRLGEAIVPHAVPAAPSDSWEAAFALLEQDVLYVPLRDAPDAAWLREQRRMFVGYAGTPPGARHEIVALPLSFDAVIYFDATTPSTALVPREGRSSNP